MNTHETAFRDAYQKLNQGQKQAVDTIEGPVMVIAGPGTGKTQVLSLRIAHILMETQTDPDGILCLTFTNSGVKAMRERLRNYIGSASSRVVVSTFHSFGMQLIEEFFEQLDLPAAPTLIDDMQSVALCDYLLREYSWEHIRTRANPAMYFKDIKSLLSLLKRERLTPEYFDAEIQNEINMLEQDPASISSRGPSRGQLKQEIVKKIKSLERTREMVQFYEHYEALKKERNVFDYDDVLEGLVQLVEQSEEAAATIRERYLYILVDEHQDSSGVQNEFLSRVWGDQETQNIFVVGDDRQLIYGFGGASLSYFEGFKQTFKGVQVITLTDNYRSTQRILNTADALLHSSLAQAPLVANATGDEPLRLVEAYYPRDEIICAGLEIKQQLAAGTPPSECAILVPKNAQVKTAARILRDMGIPVTAGARTSLFDIPEAQSVITILETLAHPTEPHFVARTLLDPLSGIPPLLAHAYIHQHDSRKLTLEQLIEHKQTLGLYPDDDAVALWANKLAAWLPLSLEHDIQGLIQTIGEEVLIRPAQDHDTLVQRVEIIRTFIHLIQTQIERDPRMTLVACIAFLRRLEEYGTAIPVATFGGDTGVQVVTLHASKGLEFEYVWIAHMDERTLTASMPMAFSLPESIQNRIEETTAEVIKRQVYVAITRAKKFCTISYARTSVTGGSLELARVVADLPLDLFDQVTAEQTEDIIMRHGVATYAVRTPAEQTPVTLQSLTQLVAGEYADRKVSVTLLNNFFSCPWKWYFRSLLMLPEPGNNALALGSIVHSAIEQLVKGTLAPDDAAIQAFVETQLQHMRGVSPDDERMIAQQAPLVVGRWANERLPRLQSSRETEKAISYRDPALSHLLITGKIDLVERLGNDQVCVTDFKTGKPKEVREIEKPNPEGRMSDYLRQLAMYSYLLEKSSKGSITVAESRLEFVEAAPVEKNALYQTVIQREHVDRLVDDIVAYDTAVREGTWIHRPCTFKPFKTGETCPYCTLAQIYTQ